MDKKEREFLRREFGLYLIRRYEDYFIRGYLKQKSYEEQISYLEELSEMFDFYINDYLKDEK